MFSVELDHWRQLLENDGEFRRASRLWSGSFAFADEEGFVGVRLQRGAVADVSAGDGPGIGDTVFRGPKDGWAKVMADVPPPYFQDLIGGAVGRHGFTIEGDTLQMAAYYPAIQRAVRLAARAGGTGGDHADV